MSAEKRGGLWATQLSFAALAALAGCTSLIGDFSESKGEKDAGDDATTADATPGTDGPAEAAPEAGPDAGSDGRSDAGPGGDAMGDAPVDGPPPTLACNSWLYPAPVVLDGLSSGVGPGQRLIGAAPSIFSVGGGVIRIVSGKPSGVPFSVYSVDRTVSPPGISRVDGPSSSTASFGGIKRSPSKLNAFTVVMTSVKTDASAGSLAAYFLPDSLPSTGPIPAPATVLQLSAGQTFPLAWRTLPIQLTSTTSQLFLGLETSTTSGATTTYDLGVSLASNTVPATLAGLFPVATSIYQDDFTRSTMFHDNANNTVYMFDTNNTANPGVSAWSVADTVPPDAGAPTKRAIGALNGFIKDIGENGTQPAANIVYEEFTQGPSGGINRVDYRVGTIPYAGASPDLDTWISTDLPIAQSFMGPAVFDAPTGFGNGVYSLGSQWVNDNIMLVGAGVRDANDAGNGGVPYGLNVFWFDSAGNVRGQANGTNRLLPTVGDFAAVSATPIAITPTSAKWAVAMIENVQTDAGGPYSILEYNELDCQ